MSVSHMPFLFLVSGPSGVGKSTLVRIMLAETSRLSVSISHTTRSPRIGEVEGRDYFFVSRETFENSIQNEEFAEYAEVHGNLYGTSKKVLRGMLDKGQDVLLDIDSNGLRGLQPQFGNELVSVFIRPPSMQVLQKRLRERKTEDDRQLRLRLANAEKEIAAADQYDYQIENDNLDAAVDRLRAILIAERSKTSRLKTVV